MDTEPTSFFERGPLEQTHLRRLLLIAYHFPPDRAAGALRWQKFAKHAATFGSSIDVITLHPSDFVSPDPERPKDLPDGIRLFGVHQPVIWAQRIEHWVWQAMRGRLHPRPIRARDTNGRPVSPSSFARGELYFDPLSPRSWIRTFYGWQYYAANRAWARRVAIVARRVFRPEVHRLVLSCGPPHGAHEAARLVARATGLPFVMDLRERIGISNAIFHPTALYPPARRSVNRVTIHSSPAVFCRILTCAASDFSQFARWHERTPSLPTGSRQDPSAFEYQAA